MLRLSVLLVAMALCAIPNAQTIMPSGQQMKWAGSLRLRLNDKEAILSATFDNKTSGLVCIDDKGAEKWTYQITTKGSFVDNVSKLGDKLLVITATDNGQSKYGIMISGLDAIVLDPATGKVLQEKNLLKLPGAHIRTMYSDKPNGELNHILLRYSKWNGEMTVFTMGKAETEKAQTAKIEVYTLSNDLTPTLKNSYSSFSDDMRFRYLTVSQNGDINISFVNPNTQQYVVEQFANGSKKATASTPLDLPKKDIDLTNPLIQQYSNPDNPNEVLTVMSYDRGRKDHFVNVVYFDLAKSSAKVHKVEMTKAYREQLEKSVEAPPSEKADIGKRGSEYITAIGATMYNGKPVVITEFGSDIDPSPYGGTPRSNLGAQGTYINAEGLVTVYNPDMTVQKQFLFPKYSAKHVGNLGAGIAFKLQENKLRLVGNDRHGNSDVIQYGEIDLQNLKWTKFGPVKKDGKESVGDPVETTGIIWWPQHMLITREEPRFSDKITFNKLFLVTYE